MSRFQATALYLAQVILSNLGASIRPAVLEPQCGFTAAERARLSGRGGMGPFSAEARATPWFWSSFCCPFFPYCGRSSVSWCEWAAAGEGWFGMEVGITWVVWGGRR